MRSLTRRDLLARARSSRRVSYDSAEVLRTRTVGCIAAFAVALLAAGSNAPPAEAAYDNMYKTRNANWDCFDGTADFGLFCQTDGRRLSWFEQRSITNQGRRSVRRVLEASFEATDLRVSRHRQPTYRGARETDIIYQEGSLPSGVLGQTWCNDRISHRRCDQHYVRFRSPSPGRKVICHESGHAVGLTHGQDAYPRRRNGLDSLGCMQTPVGQIQSYLLGKHNKRAINRTY